MDILTVWYRLNGSQYRVWRNDWQGGRFEVFNAEDFADLRKLANKLSIPVLLAEDAD